MFVYHLRGRLQIVLKLALLPIQDVVQLPLVRVIRNKTKTGIYNSKTAQELANERKERFSRKRVFNQQKKSFVIHAIKEDNWSAEQIVGYCRENNIPMVGKTTIYEFIHQDKKKGGDLYTYTRHKLKHRNR